MRTLELKEKIEGQKDKLVRKAENLKQAPKVTSAGLQNLLAIANSTQSVEEVKNFIKYQIGRRTTGRDWRTNGFGEFLIREIEDIVKNYGGGNLKYSAQLVRLFLGYVTRYAEYLRYKEGGGRRR